MLFSTSIDVLATVVGGVQKLNQLKSIFGFCSPPAIRFRHEAIINQRNNFRQTALEQGFSQEQINWFLINS